MEKKSNKSKETNLNILETIMDFKKKKESTKQRIQNERIFEENKTEIEKQKLNKHQEANKPKRKNEM